MSHFSYRLICRFLSMLVFFSIIANWKVFLVFMNPGMTTNYLLWALGAVFLLLLNIPFAIGIYNFHRWGFILGYFIIPVNALILGVCYIPLLPDFFPIHYEHFVTLIADAVFLIALIILHFVRSKTRFHLEHYDDKH